MPEGKYLPMGLVELAEHSDTVGNVNKMLQAVFNNNDRRSLKTTIPSDFMGGASHQKGVSPQLLRDIKQYATDMKDLEMPIASVDVYAPGIETRDHTYITSPTESWLSEQRQNWKWNELTDCLIVFFKGIGIKGSGILGKMEVSDWTQHQYTISDDESREEAFLSATLLIFKRLWPTRAWSVIRGKPVLQPTLQESRFLVGRSLHDLWPNTYPPPNDEPRELIQRIPRCNCKTKDKVSQLLCYSLKCKCANRVLFPGCNVLCGCLAAIETCFQVSQVPLTESVHNLSIDEVLPQSPEKRRRTIVSESSSSNSSDDETPLAESSVSADADTSMDGDTEIDEEEVETGQCLEPVIFSSRRLTNQQRERMEPPQVANLSISKENFGNPNLRPKYYVNFEGFGAVGLTVFSLQHVRLSSQNRTFENVL